MKKKAELWRFNWIHLANWAGAILKRHKNVSAFWVKSFARMFLLIGNTCILPLVSMIMDLSKWTPHSFRAIHQRNRALSKLNRQSERDPPNWYHLFSAFAFVSFYLLCIICRLQSSESVVGYVYWYGLIGLATQWHRHFIDIDCRIIESVNFRRQIWDWDKQKSIVSHCTSKIKLKPMHKWNIDFRFPYCTQHNCAAVTHVYVYNSIWSHPFKSHLCVANIQMFLELFLNESHSIR